MNTNYLERQKGTFLTALVVIFGVAITFATVFLLVDQGVRAYLGNLPTWTNAFLVGLWLGRMIALYGIWNLKRWGVYALLVLEIIELSFGMFIYSGDIPLQVRVVIGVPMFLAVLLIWYLALRSKWALFA